MGSVRVVAELVCEARFIVRDRGNFIFCWNYPLVVTIVDSLQGIPPP